MKQSKGPEKNAAEKLRGDYEKIVKRPVSPEARKKIEELLKDQKPKNDGGRSKRIAKSSDVEI